MSIPIETLEVAVLRLAPQDRARLLDRVVASLDADSARDAAWDGVAAQREAALASGATTEALLDEVLARLESRAGVTRTIHRDAEADLAAAVRFYKDEAGVGVARRFVAEFERVARLLEENPKLGSPGDSGRRGFGLTVFPYALIYRQTETGIRILVVRHQRRDPAFGAERA